MQELLALPKSETSQSQQGWFFANLSRCCAVSIGRWLSPGLVESTRLMWTPDFSYGWYIFIEKRKRFQEPVGSKNSADR
jgi:hypothetical protein